MVKIYKEREEYAPNNPINLYKKDVNKSWDDISEKCGITVQSLIRIAKFMPNELDCVTYGTYKRIKYYLGIDLADYDDTSFESKTNKDVNLV